MTPIQRTYSRSVKLAVHLILTLAIGFGAAVPQAVAYLGCSHDCCSKAADAHLKHEAVQLSGPTQPSCCGPTASDACRLCNAENQPLFDIALHSSTCGDSPTASSVAAEKRILLPGLVPQGRSGWKTTATNHSSRNLYLHTRTLLI
jgi:hypothetical protein